MVTNISYGCRAVVLHFSWTISENSNQYFRFADIKMWGAQICTLFNQTVTEKNCQQTTMINIWKCTASNEHWSMDYEILSLAHWLYFWQQDFSQNLSRQRDVLFWQNIPVVWTLEQIGIIEEGFWHLDEHAHNRLGSDEAWEQLCWVFLFPTRSTRAHAEHSHKPFLPTINMFLKSCSIFDLKCWCEDEKWILKRIQNKD